MKVVKEGTKRRVECNECGAILEYIRSDVCSEQVHYQEYAYYVVCPCCENKVKAERIFSK